MRANAVAAVLNKNGFTLGCLSLVVGMLFILTGCGGGSSHGTTLSGVFIDGAVAGLNYETASQAGTTDAAGTFRYKANETVTFSIGELELGSATGAELLTPLSLVADAADATDQRVTNRLILLQILDEDGDLNNGIQITEAIAAIVSANAASIDFDQGSTESEFPASLSTLLTALNDAGAFTDTHRGARRFLDYADPTKIAAVARAHFAHATGDRHEVETAYGTLRGFEANTDYWQYLGIRYGRAERWRAPEDPESWSGVRDAIAYGDQAPQYDSYAVVSEGNVSEDCLVLNITAPKEADGLPVMVWFHGGAFGILSGNTASYNNPDSLPAKEVVLVTVNHRLGAFGYLAHPELTTESGYSGSGNYGQLDLIKALEWVRDNIDGFGGDPGNVTIFGQSGGGGKSISLMASPLATGLFHKVICQSGMAESSNEVLNHISLAAAEAKGTDLATRLAGGGDPLTLAQMRALPFSAIVMRDLLDYGAAAWVQYVPNVDGRYLTASMNDLLSDEDGLASDVPLLAGAMAADNIAGANLAPGVAEQMPLRAANNDAAQFIYYWSYVPPGWEDLGVGAYHGLELVYVFNYPLSFISHHLLRSLGTDYSALTGLTDADIGADPAAASYYSDIMVSTGYYLPSAGSAGLTDDVLTIWTNFARNGDPSAPGVIDVWPAYTGPAGDGGSDAYVEIESDETNGYAITPKTDVQAAFNPIT